MVSRSRLETLTTITIALAAAAVGGSAIRREIRQPITRTRYVVDVSGPPSYLKDWRDIAKSGILIGKADAPVQVIEFADFECSFCRRFHSSFLSAKEALGDDLSLLFIHYPLERHRFARPAAQAAECARQAGAFERFHDLLFRKQDSLGLKSWISFAVDAGISDVTRFQRCTDDSRPSPTIEAGMALGQRVGVTGTPTVLINGWRFPTAPYDSLVDIIGRIRARVAPFDRPE